MYSCNLILLISIITQLTVESSCICKNSIPVSKSSEKVRLNSQPTDDRSRKLSSQPLGIPHAINGFSFKLYQALSKSSPDDNLFYSPVGIVYAFSMLMLGASDQSELEVFHGLHLNESFRTPEEAHKAFRGILKVVESNANYSLDLANIILIQKDERFLKEFTKRLGNFYRVAIGEVDFLRNGKQVMADINSWVSNNTHNKIKNLLKNPLDTLTRLVILNAVYFKGKWLNGFEKDFTVESVFYNFGNKRKNVPFMQNTANYGYLENKEKKYKLLEMKYKGEVSFFVVLPDEKEGLDTVMRNLVISELFKPLEEKKVQISIPKFGLETEYDLKKVLPELGIKAIFGPGANLSGINGDKTLFVSTGIHKSMLEVNEEGTEAASGTGIGVGNRNYQYTPTFNADHPFIFFIRNTKHGIIYFMGRVNAL